MEAEDGDGCTAHNLSGVDSRELRDIVQQVVDSAGAHAVDLFPRFSAVITHYQEQPQLLDPILEALVRPLADLLLSLTGPDAVPHLAASSRLLWHLAVVRGYKTVLRFFPNEVAALEPVSALLSSLSRAPCELSFTGQHWEAQYVLLMWLSLLAMIPFDLALVDSSLGKQSVQVEQVGQLEKPSTTLGNSSTGVALNGAGTQNGTITITAQGEAVPHPPPPSPLPGCPPIAANLINMCKEFLSSPGPTREMAAVLIGRLVTRPDMQSALDSYLAWACEAVEVAGRVQASERDYDPKAAFLIPGVTLSLTIIFKLGKRQAVETQALKVLPLGAALLGSPVAASNALVRKLAVKLVQRAGLAFLPERPASWRYQRGQRTLGSLSSSSSAIKGGRDKSSRKQIIVLEEEEVFHQKQQEEEKHRKRQQEKELKESEEQEVKEDEEEEGDWSADEQQAEAVETAIESMLSALGDKDTVVRWSAAKGLGRITGRLPKIMGDEVVAAVLDSFSSPIASDATWHGGCLALAELTRRGLLLPERLAEAVPVVTKALEYDVRRGHCSAGAHVRDAAAYVCWAVARAYSQDTLGDAAPKLAPALITAACFDREVNCRRAAAAAFQESVGRLGAFPHGIDILTAADYFTVSMRTAAYTRVAPTVASYPGYLQPFALHLLHSKLQHWEKSLRELAASALASLVPLQPSFFQQQAMDHLLPLCTSYTLESRHGAVAAIAELLPALRAAVSGPEWLPVDTAAAVANILPEMDRLKLTRGKGGEVMRSAVCRLVQTMSETGLALSIAQLTSAHAVAMENLHHPSADIQQAAAIALSALVDRYLPREEKDISSERENQGENQKDILSAGSLIERLQKDMHPTVAVTARRGAALALGTLPAWALRLRAANVVDTLTTAVQLEEQQEARDVETRVNAAKALPHAVHAVWSTESDLSLGKSSGSAGRLETRQLAESGVFASLLAAMEDYSMDNRGDVGSWVRDAAMQSLQDLLLMLGGTEIASNPTILNAAHTALLLTLRQSVERIGRVRERAGKLLPSLAAVCSEAGVEGAAQIADVARDIVLEDISSGHALPVVAGLLNLPSTQEYLLEGLAYSIGGLDAQLAEVAAEAVVEAIGASPRETEDCHLSRLGQAFLKVWSRHSRSPRMATPLLVTAEVLLSRTDLQDLQPPSSDFLSRAFELANAEVAGCTDVPRLHAASGVLCQLAGALPQGSLQRDCLSAAVSLVGNRYPKVRRYAAEQLYTTLLAWEVPDDGGDFDDDGNQEQGSITIDIDRAMEVFGDTPWDGPAEVVRPARLSLYGLLGLPPPAARTVGERSETSEVRQIKDDNANYRALLDHVERGM